MNLQVYGNKRKNYLSSLAYLKNKRAKYNKGKERLRMQTEEQGRKPLAIKTSLFVLLVRFSFFLNNRFDLDEQALSPPPRYSSSSTE